MKPRRVARELAVILISQLPKKSKKLESIEIEKLLTTSIESLTDYGKQLLEDSSAELTKAGEKLEQFERNHPDNASLVHRMRSVDVSSEFLREHLSSIDKALAFISEALVIPELTLAFSQENRSEVREFALELINTYIANKADVEKIASEMKSKWRSERMMSIDRSILNLALTELFFMPDTPCPVCINEAIELCHRFADKRAAKFLNGVLGDLVEDAEYFRETGELREKTDQAGSSSEATSEEPVA